MGRSRGEGANVAKQYPPSTVEIASVRIAFKFVKMPTFTLNTVSIIILIKCMYIINKEIKM